eukprot:355524-Chlamydomonas_euryale.AAC.38
MLVCGQGTGGRGWGAGESRMLALNPACWRTASACKSSASRPRWIRGGGAEIACAIRSATTLEMCAVSPCNVPHAAKKRHGSSVPSHLPQQVGA